MTTSRRDFLTRLGLGALVGAVVPKVLSAEPVPDVPRVSAIDADSITWDATPRRIGFNQPVLTTSYVDGDLVVNGQPWGPHDYYFESVGLGDGDGWDGGVVQVFSPSRPTAVTWDGVSLTPDGRPARKRRKR